MSNSSKFCMMVVAGLIAGLFSQNINAGERSAFSFKVNEFTEGNEFTTKIHKKIYESVISEDGEINAYENTEFSSPLSYDEIQERAVYEELIEVTPDPDDPYYTVDSVVTYQRDPDMVEHYRVSVNQDRDIGLIGFTYKPKKEGQLKNETMFAIIDPEEVRNFLGEEQYNKFAEEILKME